MPDKIELVGNLFVTVSEWKGQKRPSIRVHYADNGEWKPGKNGINMTKEQWEEFKSRWDEIKSFIDGQMSDRQIQDYSVVERDTFERAIDDIGEC